MKRYLLPLAFAASLSACGTRPTSVGDIVATAPSRIDQVERDFQAAKAFVDMLEPLLPASRVAQIHKLEAKIASAIAIARQAATVAEQIRALADAAGAISELTSAPIGASPGGATLPN